MRQRHSQSLLRLSYSFIAGRISDDFPVKPLYGIFNPDPEIYLRNFHSVLCVCISLPLEADQTGRTHPSILLLLVGIQSPFENSFVLMSLPAACPVNP